jgi:hypothetical protein
LLVHGLGRAAGPWLGGAALAGLAWGLGPGLWAPPHADVGGPHPQSASVLELTDPCLASLDGARRATILATVPVRMLAQWVVLQRYGSFERLEEHWYGFGDAGPANRQGFRDWLHTTSCDTLIFFAHLPGQGHWEDVAEVALHAELGDLLRQQRVFRLAEEHPFPRHGCTVQVWRKRD